MELRKLTMQDPEWHMLQAAKHVSGYNLYMALSSVIIRIANKATDPQATLYEIAYHLYNVEQYAISEQEDEDMMKTAVAAPEPSKGEITEKEITRFLSRFDELNGDAAEDPFEGFDLEDFLRGRDDDHA